MTKLSHVKADLCPYEFARDNLEIVRDARRRLSPGNEPRKRKQ
jgi:hypothetical protein